MPVPYLSNKSELDEYLSQCDALILYFTATWCGPCRAIAPVVEQLYSSYPNVEIVKVDLDAQRAVAGQYQIAAVPTFVVIHKGKEIERVRGAHVEQVFATVKNLSQLAPEGKRRSSDAAGSKAGSSLSNDSIFNGEVSQYIGKGFSILNKTVFFNDFESLNTLPLTGNEDVKNLIRTDATGETAVISDADSQLILHIPLTNVCKISSILIKSKEHEDTQRPEKLKVWANRSSVTSFEDATSITGLHEEELTQWDENGWCEVKLKYVRFQKVTALDLFFDGEDEDEHTVIDKVLIVGVDGDSKTQGKLEKIGHDD